MYTEKISLVSVYSGNQRGGSNSQGHKARPGEMEKVSKIKFEKKG